MRRSIRIYHSTPSSASLVSMLVHQGGRENRVEVDRVLHHEIPVNAVISVVGIDAGFLSRRKGNSRSEVDKSPAS